MDYRYAFYNTNEYNKAISLGFSNFMMLQPSKITDTLMKHPWVYGDSRNPNSPPAAKVSFKMFLYNHKEIHKMFC